MRLRATQVTAVVAVLLGLVQLGRMITGETATPPRARDRYANEQLFEPPSQVAATSEPGRAGALGKADELAAGKPKDCAAPHRRNQPSKPDQNSNETSKRPGKTLLQARTEIVTGSNIPVAEDELAAEHQRKRLLQRWLIAN